MLREPPREAREQRGEHHRGDEHASFRGHAVRLFEEERRRCAQLAEAAAARWEDLLAHEALGAHHGVARLAVARVGDASSSDDADVIDAGRSSRARAVPLVGLARLVGGARGERRGLGLGRKDDVRARWLAAPEALGRADAARPAAVARALARAADRHALDRSTVLGEASRTRRTRDLARRTGGGTGMRLGRDAALAFTREARRAADHVVARLPERRWSHAARMGAHESVVARGYSVDQAALTEAETPTARAVDALEPDLAPRRHARARFAVVTRARTARAAQTHTSNAVAHGAVAAELDGLIARLALVRVRDDEVREVRPRARAVDARLDHARELRLVVERSHAAEVRAEPPHAEVAQRVGLAA